MGPAFFLVRVLMARQGAGICQPGIGDGLPGVRRNDVHVKVHQALAADRAVHCAHPVGGVADRTAEAVIDVAGMLGEAGVGQDLRQVMAFRAERVWSIDTQVRIREQIGDQLAGHYGL